MMSACVSVPAKSVKPLLFWSVALAVTEARKANAAGANNSGAGKLENNPHKR